MTLQDQIATDVDDVFLNTEDFSESITAIDLVAVETAITANVDRNPFESQFNHDGDVTVKKYAIEFSVSTIADPAGYTFRIDGEEFYIDKQDLVAANAMHRLLVVNTNRENVRHSDSRINRT